MLAAQNIRTIIPRRGARRRESSCRAPSTSNSEAMGCRLIHRAKGSLLKGTPPGKYYHIRTPREAKQEGAGRKQKKTAYGAALGCFSAGAGRAGSCQGNAKNSYGAAFGCFCGPSRKHQPATELRSVVFAGRGLAEQETPKTAYGAALDCFCGPRAGRAGNAKNCLRSCVLGCFLRAGGWPSRRRQNCLQGCVRLFLRAGAGRAGNAKNCPLGCFCRPGAGRAGNAKNCPRSCVRLFLRAGGWPSRRRQKLPTELR